MRIERSFLPMSDRYAFDFGLCHPSRGWAQIDTSQDAYYYGTWASPARREILNYVEGDVTRWVAESDAEFAAEIRRFKAWNEAHGWKFRGIDTGGNAELIEGFARIGLGDLLYASVQTTKGD